MEFYLDSNNAPGHTEVNFTSSWHDPPVFAKTVTVAAKQQLVIFIDIVCGRPTSDAGRGTGTSWPLTADGTRPLEVQVSSRTVRNFRTVVRLTGRCFDPSFTLQHGPMHFVLEAASPASDANAAASPTATMFEQTQTATVRSVSSAPLDIVVLGNLVYFTVKIAYVDEHTQQLVFELNRGTVTEHLGQLMKYRHAVEHVSIYSRGNLAEVARLEIRLCHGRHTEFIMSPWRGLLRLKLGDLENRVARLVCLLRVAVTPVVSQSRALVPPPRSRLRAGPGAGADEGGTEVTPTSWGLRDANGELLFQFVSLVDELIYTGLSSKGCNDYLFGRHLAQLLFTSILGNMLFRQHAPAALPGWAVGRSSGLGNGPGTSTAAGGSNSGSGGVSGSSGGAGVNGGMSSGGPSSGGPSNGAVGGGGTGSIGSGVGGPGAGADDAGDRPLSVSAPVPEWPAHLQPWLNELCKYLAAFVIDFAQLPSLLALKDGLIRGGNRSSR
jgi:hypothetical protein